MYIIGTFCVKLKIKKYYIFFCMKLKQYLSQTIMVNT